jgi:hypothetical protein
MKNKEMTTKFAAYCMVHTIGIYIYVGAPSNFNV